jgi:Flagellar biosynthesis protein, FliO
MKSDDFESSWRNSVRRTEMGEAIARSRNASGSESGAVSQTIWNRVGGFLRGCLAAMPRRAEKRLKLCETLSLGERRFVAVVRYREQQFLVGGTGQSIALLAHLPPAERDERENSDGNSRIELT